LPLVDRDSLDKTLEDFIVKDGDVFMVEMRFGDTWPRDQMLEEHAEFNPSIQNTVVKKTVTKDWRNFEVGDRIDVLDVRFSEV
jgi:hypothetical protein